MFEKTVSRFKKNPMIYYACSIVASWAGVGSLMNFKTLAVNNGGWSAIIWALFNSAACIIFGLLVEFLPTMRKIMKSKVMFYFIGFLTVFQSWTQMSGIREIFADTVIGTTGGAIIAYAFAILFVAILIKRGMIRNALTDAGSWVLVYVMLLFVTIASLVITNGQFNQISMEFKPDVAKAGIINGLLLLAGPFTYPYYYEVYDYNESNADGTRRISNIKTSFVLAGVMFGVYMLFAGLLSWTQFTPWLNVVKAVLITIIAVSSLSTYLYSEYLVFGKKIGAVVNIATVAGWQFLIPLGVMGIWQLMSKIRWIFILGAIVLAIILKIRDRKCQA